MFSETTSIELKLAFRKVDKKDIADRLIAYWTNSKFCHVEIIIDNLWISSNLEGVHIKDLKPLKDTYEYLPIDVVITKQQYKEIISWIYRQHGKSYDKLGILMAQLLPFRLDNRNKWFCSELVCKILQLLHVEEVIDNYPFLTSPGDLAKTFKIE